MYYFYRFCHPGLTNPTIWNCHSSDILDPTDEIRVPPIRSNTFVDEEERVWIIFLLDGKELIVVSAKE